MLSFRTLAAVSALLAGLASVAQSASGLYLPPVTPVKTALKEGLPASKALECTALAGAPMVFNSLAGQNEALTAWSESRPYKAVPIAVVEPVVIGSDELLTGLTVDGGATLFSGRISSEGAEALRIQVDLSRLEDGARIYVVDERAGLTRPARIAGRDGLVWLPSVDGDTATIIIQSPTGQWPEVLVTSLAHYFRNRTAAAEQIASPSGKGLKAKSCNNNIACEEDPAIQEASSAVGRMEFVSGLSVFLCTGSLLNVPGTPEQEPYFLTANHCVSTQEEVDSLEVFWDYRAAACDALDGPALSSLPSSNGMTLLATDGLLDATLIELDSAPAGEFGRAYLGWTATLPEAGAPMIGIHHPSSFQDHMRISYGNVTVPSQTVTLGFTLTYDEQIGMSWFDGVTEGGSSGSPLITDGADLQVVGVLSNGTFHVCPEDAAVNTDNYGSFPAFFPQIEQLLTVNTRTDVDKSGEVDATDIQLTINGALGLAIGVDADVNDDGVVDAVDVQLVIITVLGQAL